VVEENVAESVKKAAEEPLVDEPEAKRAKVDDESPEK
jgi:hypothetical protein